MSQAPLTQAELDYYSIDAPLFGFLGAAFALIFSNLGAAYGTGKSGMGISALGVGKPELVMKSIVPVRAVPRAPRSFSATPRTTAHPAPHPSRRWSWRVSSAFMG
jgi:hypothetical protein